MEASVQTSGDGSVPKRAGAVLAALILVAAVANLNLAVANVALPEIGKDLDASQTALNLIAVGFSLGLAASVLYLGALGDRYGRKQMILIGVGIAIPASLVAAKSNSVEMLFAARLVGGIAAGMAFPTTLALITALWAGPARTKTIALWSGIGGAISALGPLASGFLLEHYHWGSVFLITIPLAVVALVLTWFFVPAHVNESTEPVDNLGGLISIVMVGSLVMALNFAPVQGKGAFAALCGVIAVVTIALFVLRQRRAKPPLYDLDVASRRIFWVAATSGIIVFGSLMAAMFVGQQFLQNVLAYSSLDAGLSILPAAVFMVLVAPSSGKLVEQYGSRAVLFGGQLVCLVSFVWMLLFWKAGISYLHVGIAYSLMGIGVGLAGTPASRSLTGSVPRRRAGMASATGDLQRDLGGAIMQSILGALLTAGYAASVSSQISGSPNADKVSDSTQAALTKSFGSAADLAESYPQYSQTIITGARTAFVDGQDWAYVAGILLVALGATLTFFMFPKHNRENELLEEYASEDAATAPS